MHGANGPALRCVVAVCDDWGIGHEGRLLVRNAEDMRHFVRLTSGHTVVMGRRTLEGLPGGRPLKNRRNVVLSANPAFAVEGAEVVRSVPELEALLAATSDEAWVIGGARVYKLLLDACAEAYVTKNHVTLPADAFFPNLDERADWRLAECLGSGVTDDGVPFELLRYERAGAAAGDTSTRA